MLALAGPEELEDPAFKWDKKRGVGMKNRNIQFYESFSYDGVDYALYDCVYMHMQGEPTPYIGKLVKIWELAGGTKKVKIHWFFRPSEISYYLKDVKVTENELFFASGDGKGLTNVNPLEAIAGKCSVICTSADSRNPQPSVKELQMADYVFYRIFDVKSCTISDKFDDKVGGLEVNFVFNRKEAAETLDGPKLVIGEKYEGNMVAFKETPQIAGPALKETCDKNLGSNICEKKDKVKDIEFPVNQVHVEKGVKHAQKSCDLDDAPSKRVKVGNSGLSELNGVEGVKNYVGCKKDANKNKSEISSPLDGKSVSLPEEASIPGQVEDVVWHKKNLKLNNNSNVLQGKLSSPHDRGNLISCGEKTSRTIVGSCDVTQRPSMTNVSPKETPKIMPTSDMDGSEPVANPPQSLSTSKKRPLEMVESAEKSNLVLDKAHENKEEKLSSNSCSNDEGYLKKAKLDKSIKQPEENENSNSKKVKEKMHMGPKNSQVVTCDNIGKLGANEGPSKDHNEKKNLVNEMKNSSKSLTCNVYKTQSKFREGSSKEYDDEKNDKNNLPKSLTYNENTKSKIFEGASKEYDNDKNGKKNLPKSLTCNDKAKLKLRDGTSKDYGNEKDGKLSNDNLRNRIGTISEDGGRVGAKIIEVTRRPPEKATWMKLSWEKQMEIAHDKGRLVLLLNLDPQYTSGEVEVWLPHFLLNRLLLLSSDWFHIAMHLYVCHDIIWHTFRERCTARVVPHTAISNPSSGQAFVVFKSSDAANKVVHQLDEECLMLPNQRPLVACHVNLPKLFEKLATYVGHLDIDKDRRQMLREMKEAVSTSHYSQHNTVEYEMAMDWCLLQSQSDAWWKRLYEQQWKELKKNMDDFKSK
ncbi:protein ANTI-SILENCING 1-like isoform X1 [Salvia splendens]|uniref:protein ANTI-SILENCING 1-like isoform X1 n=1 Tax=Salvia splendens TaxID=180675 RepID=UPI001C25A7E3|nr:protein ANTI-SILENCING 1-like isoform X1 [Salvia splendens]